MVTGARTSVRRTGGPTGASNCSATLSSSTTGAHAASSNVAVAHAGSSSRAS